MDQITIGDLASYDDFEASLASRKIKPPKKKSIKETVPFSNITHDFSDINGETYWEERELEYTFEITADTPEELENLKRRFTSWLMGVKEQKLHDPHIPDYHFLATYEDSDPEDDEGLDKTTLTVTFTAYPYMIANVPKVYQFTYPDIPYPYSLIVLNESDHPVPLTVRNDQPITLKVGDALTAALPIGDGTYSALKLPVGQTTLVFVQTGGPNPAQIRISFHEEVF